MFNLHIDFDTKSICKLQILNCMLQSKKAGLIKNIGLYPLIGKFFKLVLSEVLHGKFPRHPKGTPYGANFK